MSSIVSEDCIIITPDQYLISSDIGLLDAVANFQKHGSKASIEFPMDFRKILSKKGIKLVLFSQVAVDRWIFKIISMEQLKQADVFSSFQSYTVAFRDGETIQFTEVRAVSIEHAREVFSRVQEGWSGGKFLAAIETVNDGQYRLCCGLSPTGVPRYKYLDKSKELEIYHDGERYGSVTPV